MRTSRRYHAPAMRILMVMHANAPWAALYSRWFLARGDDVFVVSFHPDVIPGVRSVFLGVEPFDTYANKHVYLTRVPQVRREIRRFAPDLVYAPYLLSNGLTATLSAPRPIVVSALGGDVQPQPEHPAWRRVVQRRLVQLACSRASAVHSVAPHLSDALRAAGVPDEKITEFPVGVDLSRFHPDAAAPRAAGPPRIVCTRSHQPVYDIPTLIDALARLDARGVEFRATFVGGGDRLEAHRRLASERGLEKSAEFVGVLPHERLPQELRRADVYVSAALSDGTSACLLEALATGLLPVVTDHPANRGWLEHGRTGLLFPPGDAGALASALERALRDVELRRRARQAGPGAVAARGSLEANMRRMEQLFDAVVAGAPIPRHRLGP